MIYLLRHGQSITNAQGLLVGRLDAPLSERGEAQAVAAAPHLDGVVAVWTSPLARARRTAALALPHLEAEVKDAFIEVDYGWLEGTSLAEVTAAQWRDVEADHGNALGDGESLAQVDARVHDVLDALLGDSSSWLHRPDEHLLITSHVAPIKSAIAWALGVSGAVASRLRIDNASLSVIGLRRNTPSLIRCNVPTSNL